jgi:predicted RNA-binding protein (virulence factor B family)
MESRKLTLGKTYSLKINRFVDFGCYLDGENLGEILLPIRYVPKDAKEGDEVEVFIHTDSEDRIIATDEKPYIQVGQFAALKAVSVTKIGAFMDWGLMKDLFVPFFEQQKKMEEGNIYVVFAYVDTETNRIAASSKLDQFMTLAPPPYEAGEEVDIIICNKSPLGYKAIINESHWGLIYENQVFEKIRIGDKRKAYIANVRNDDKIDLVLNKTGLEHIDEVAHKILEAVKQEEFIALHDKSDADEIKKEFGISKKAFKKAIGSLYKKRLIAIEDIGIRYIGKK